MKPFGENGPVETSPVKEWAQKRNLCVYRLKGVVGTLKGVAQSGTVTSEEKELLTITGELVNEFVNLFVSPEKQRLSKEAYLGES